MIKDVNKHLMWQLDRLTSISDEDLEKDIDAEVKRAKAIVDVSKSIFECANIVLEANRMSQEYNVPAQGLLGFDNEKD